MSNMTTRQKIVRILANNKLNDAVNFSRTDGYSILDDGSSSYSISSKFTKAASVEQKILIDKICAILSEAGIEYRTDTCGSGHKEIVVRISNPSR